ncbi:MULTISPECIES: helix-turn-helix transcriptional regulator [unclassified Nocardia]|uniref:helix-turn-helix transcriptional regulator n=1 Tax=unclassified Nocardia TaxID=2637762 RepID=UPI001CE4211B|nr:MULTISPECIES: helix-turn-helix transcriptional regulator [unclassified Nocardia]
MTDDDHRKKREVSRRVLRGFLPDKLADAIDAAGLNNYTLARLSDVSRQTLTNWLSGRATPSIDLLRRVLEVLQQRHRDRGLAPVTIGDLYTYDRDNPMLSDLRIMALLTQPELGRKAGLPTTVVRELEIGTVRLMPHHVTKLADALGEGADEALVTRAYDNTRRRDAEAEP